MGRPSRPIPVSVHEAAVGASVEWYTPITLFANLGVFDLDPACGRAYCDVPALEHWSEDGDRLPWYGRVWLNPPYGPAAVPFVERMIAHNRGLLLLPARTETRLFQKAARAAESVCFLRERLWFTRGDGFRGRSSFGSVLFGFSEDLADLGLGWTV